MLTIRNGRLRGLRRDQEYTIADLKRIAARSGMRVSRTYGRRLRLVSANGNKFSVTPAGANEIESSAEENESDE